MSTYTSFAVIEKAGRQMTLSTELIISLVIQLVSIGIFIGVFKATVAFMQQQIEDIKTTLKDDKQELKDEMRRYNSVLERMIICEQSTKSAHHRIDDLLKED